MNRKVLLIVINILLINFGFAEKRNPLKDPNICGRPYCENPTKFKIDLHHTYKYEYSMFVKTEFYGSGQNTSELHITANVEVSFPTKCEGILRLSSVELRDQPVPIVNEENEDEYQDEIELHPQSEIISEHLEENELRFSFHDGAISEICPHESESVWVQNFKRGILSSLQNTMKRFDVDHNTTETDVSGTCDVSYILDSSKSTNLIIKKNKNISTCKNRYKTHSFLQTTPYDFGQNNSAWSILKTDSSCTISINNYMYNEVNCTEKHLLVPFSNNDTGAVTESFSKLVLVDTETADETGKMTYIEHRAKLTFDHTPSIKSAQGEIKISRDLLKQMCKFGFPDIQRGFSDVFIRFLSTARLLSYTTLQQLLARSHSICTHGRNHVIESLPFIGSTASVKLMKDQIVNKQISKDVTQQWLESFAYIRRPDTEMLESMFELIQYGNSISNFNFILTATSVVHTYCKQLYDCSAVEEVQQIVEYLERNLQETLTINPLDRKTKENIITTLKGLGNIGVISDSLDGLLNSIIEDEEIFLEIRVQAIKSFRRYDCLKKRNYFLELYVDKKELSEIRIASYLQVMKCPDYLSIRTIKQRLHNEEVNQVGSFVWSHLNNLAKSASPTLIEIQALLIDSDLGNKFRLDIRKFSRNYEYSLFFDEYNVGATTDANLIFGTDSYLPRTFDFNYTVNLFGESINFFEMNFRAEGFEQYVESIFGPKGSLNTQKFIEKFWFLSRFFKSTNTFEDDTLSLNLDKILNGKVKRETESPDTKEILSNRVDNVKYKLKYNFKEPKASLGLKIFGNDLKYFTLEGLNEAKNFIDDFNILIHLKKMLSGQEFVYSKSTVFLDVAYVVPLSTGLPLKIDVLGASSIDLRISGSLRAENDLKKIDVDGKIKPSISLDVISSMTSDFFVCDTGIKVKSNLYSSSELEAKIKIHGLSSVSTQFSLPRERNEIISMRSELLVMKNNEEIRQQGIRRRYTNSTCTWPFIDKAIGLKICADYSLPDVSNAKKTVPSLILSGPIKLDVNLEKADSTAKVFLFEYNFENQKNYSVGTLIFETPGSKIPRLFRANLTKGMDECNISTTFISGDTEHTAIGNFRLRKNDTRFDVSLSINNKKHFSLEVGMNRTEVKYGWVYFPTFFLSINNERIAGMAGTIKATDKKGILQFDVNLQFETKKLQTKLGGYITRTDASVSSKMTFDYRFLDNPQQTIDFEAELANRSNRGRTEIIGSLQLKSTAYPYLNFTTNMKFLSALGHIELKTQFNNAPDLKDPNYTLTTRLVFAKFHSLGSDLTTASYEIIRLKTKTDFKIMLRHEEKVKKGMEYNSLLLLRYAPQKEVTAFSSILLPKTQLFAIDIATNITVPHLDSCVLNLKINEKERNEYNIYLDGLWFSGHSIIINGVYQDRSSLIKVYHHLKFVVQSPSFDEVNVDIKYLRDEFERKFDIQGEYMNETYGLLIKKLESDTNETSTYAEIKWREKLYWISANMKTAQSKELLLDIHIDKIKDINVILRGLSNVQKKEFGIEVKWDANRDPSQKLVLSAEYNNPNIGHYNGGFLIIYPDRTLKFSTELAAINSEYTGAVRLAWSNKEAIEFNLNARANFEDLRQMWLKLHVTTPFDGWRQNSFITGYYFENNYLKFNISGLWAEVHQIGFDFAGNYNSDDSAFNGQIKTQITSTIENVPTVVLELHHKHDNKKTDSDLFISHKVDNEPAQIFLAKSTWHFDSKQDSHNVSGTVTVKTPFKNYTKGVFITRFLLNEYKLLRGAAELQIEDRQFTLVLDGHINSFLDNMLAVNITTPIEKFKQISGRFGINDKKKHVVAEVQSPGGELGVEILFFITSSSKFDIKFHLATPIEKFTKVLLVGKLMPETVDFRGGLNSAVLGFVGVWRKNNITDFEYSYRVYTPLEKFENNGLVARLVKNQYLDMEFSIKFSQYKLGVSIVAKPKPKEMRQLKKQKSNELLIDFLSEEDFKNKLNESEDEEEEEDDEIEDQLISFFGYAEINVLFWPTIRGNLDFEEIGDVFVLLGTLKLPQGLIEVQDHFYFPDFLTSKNKLQIKTPFTSAKEIKSNFELLLDIGYFYITSFEVKVLNNNNWISTEYHLNYTTLVDESEQMTHEVKFNLKIPSEYLPKIYVHGIVESEENLYRGNLTIRTIATTISLASLVELEENFMDTSFALSLVTPLIPVYSVRVYSKQDNSEIENSVEFGFSINNNDTISNFRLESTWQKDHENDISLKGKIQTNIIPLTEVEGTILVTRKPHPIASIDVFYTDKNGIVEMIKGRATRNQEFIIVEISLPIDEYKNVTLFGTLYDTDEPQMYTIDGNLYRNSENFEIHGKAKIVNDIPLDVYLIYKPIYGVSTNGRIMYNVSINPQNDEKHFEFQLTKSDKFVKILGNILVKNYINWLVFFNLLSSENIAPNIKLDSKILPISNDEVIAQFDLSTPWKEYWIEKVKVNVKSSLHQRVGKIVADYNLMDTVNGDALCEWSWIIMENMQFLLEYKFKQLEMDEKYFKTILSYTNPKKQMQRLSVGAHLNVNSLYVVGTNATIYNLSPEDMGVELSVLLPKPFAYTHKIMGKYRGKGFEKNDKYLDMGLEATYEIKDINKKYLTRMYYRNVSDIQGFGRVEWGPNDKSDAVETNVQILRKGLRKELFARLTTPMHTEDTLVARGSYDNKDIYHIVSGIVFSPASEQIADADIAFSTLSNMKGNVNSTTPFLKNITWLRGDFDFSTEHGEFIRYIKVSWPNDTATFDSKSTEVLGDTMRDQQGTIKIEFPLQTRHNGIINYGLKEKPTITTGHADVEYNDKNVLNGQYTSKLDKRVDYEKEIVDVTLKNEHFPIGVHYIHIVKNIEPDNHNYDFKRAEIFELKNAKKFNLTGELEITNTQTGYKYTMKAIHPNRTVVLKSEYDYQNQTTKQRTKLQLAPSVWMAYDFKLQNLSVSNNESQLFSIALSYPKRNISTEGHYTSTIDSFDSDISFKYTGNKTDGYFGENDYEIQTKHIKGAFKWQQLNNDENNEHNQSISFSIGHPSFEKDITFKGYYYKDLINLLKTNLIIDYCNSDEHIFTLTGDLRDLTSIVGYKNYSYGIIGTHEASEFDLESIGSIGIMKGFYKILSNAHYKRGYLPLQEGETLAFVDFNNYEIKYDKINPQSIVKFNTKYQGNFPVYKINGSYEDSPDIESAGVFYLNLFDKIISLDVNMTPDASQNLKMLGIIPDARSIFFDLHRDYEDIRVIDVAYYLKMNHSRLITSEFIWRPQLKNEIKHQIRQSLTDFYNVISENVDFWVKTIYAESVDTINDVWREAKPYAQDFLDDVSELSVLQEDLEDFRIFLNDSYNADDFYIRSVVNFTITILDELAIKNHIASVPRLLKEIWQVMGESGQAVRKSIMWLVDMIKTSYKNVADIIAKILHGESFTHVSDMMQNLVAKYDRFIKDVHLSFIKYVQNIWSKLTDTISSYWKRMLQNIEPSIIKLVHYLETLAWNFSKEVFDFLYKRTNELVESPYFNQVSNFTQDLDRLYKDLVGNDAITNIKKYSMLIWKFAKEKYFKIVPFGKELNDIITELYEELKTLQKLETVRFLVQRIEEITAKVEWLAEEFQVEKRIHEVWRILTNKLMRYAQTALQADNRYREAKTKFIFDPDNGILKLEQKLPMSWHAFNDTPKFEEIPEYKVICDIQNFFAATNISLWSLYYEYKPYTDPNMWLPPFKAHSLIIGNRFYVTFDKKFTSMDMRYTQLSKADGKDDCSYMLAHDFHNKTFTLLSQPSVLKNYRITSRKITLITDSQVIDMDVTDSTLKIGQNLTSALPAQIHDTVIYRDADILVIESDKGFYLECNLQFYVCSFDLSGWYFGKTAGILGTMNNEMFDDFTTAENKYAENETQFINSWSLPDCEQQIETTNFGENYYEAPKELIQLCDSFFKTKLSYFASCFSIVDASSFYEMCIDLGLHSLANVIDSENPINKGACSAALAYIDACSFEKTPLRVPDVCVHCDLINGSYVPEGTFIRMEENEIPRTAEIVFIVEAKSCNENITENKSIMTIVNALNKELTDMNITDNRYSVIAFGGEQPFDKPRSIIINGNTFAKFYELEPYFQHIKMVNGTNKDMFEAIITAAKLIFRPGASKIFILVPCSECLAHDMKLDYSSVLQLLLENGINMHILMNQDIIGKARDIRSFFGMDREKAYTKNDVKHLIGDIDLRKQIRLPKASVGICSALAIETNGSIFTSKKLQPDKRHPIKKLSTVFGKRVAFSAMPNTCQTCECTGHNTGVAYMTCFPCSYPSAFSLDYDFNENSMLSILQSDHDFTWEDEEEEDF
uniref:Putative lipoprotein n=1 Tax=Corethrella appendiculata TaxID=1370023 RepID=W4VR36_9DIPT